MSRAKCMLLFSLPVLLAACASSPAPLSSSDDAGYKETKYITGSNIPHHNNKTEVLSDQAVQDLADKIHRGSVSQIGKP